MTIKTVTPAMATELMETRALMDEVRAEGWVVEFGPEEVPMIFAPLRLPPDPRMQELVDREDVVAALLRGEAFLAARGRLPGAH